MVKICRRIYLFIITNIAKAIGCARTNEQLLPRHKGLVYVLVSTMIDASLVESDCIAKRFRVNPVKKSDALLL